ncbi:hypothetical protein Nepgr_015861 [Nepenthes gracilis]|uniref:Uncharacterized protein n=1 Tax=Nepenthes gracilis TaxID=150966 RepID=A0AAD3SNL0_NEPGR|nr:hypothetical protein Nepgr_015861 [Nepenthes gracilis]
MSSNTQKNSITQQLTTRAMPAKKSSSGCTFSPASSSNQASTTHASKKSWIQDIMQTIKTSTRNIFSRHQQTEEDSDSIATSSASRRKDSSSIKSKVSNHMRQYGGKWA